MTNQSPTEMLKQQSEMKKRHIKEQRTEDCLMKGLFAVMCPLILLTPWFWSDDND